MRMVLKDLEQKQNISLKDNKWENMLYRSFVWHSNGIWLSIEVRNTVTRTFKPYAIHVSP